MIVQLRFEPWLSPRWVLRLCLNWIRIVLIWFSFISLLPSWEFNLVYFSWILIYTTGDSAQPQNWIDPEFSLIINKDYPEHPFVSNCPFLISDCLSDEMLILDFHRVRSKVVKSTGMRMNGSRRSVAVGYPPWIPRPHVRYRNDTVTVCYPVDILTIRFNWIFGTRNGQNQIYIFIFGHLFIFVAFFHSIWH